MQHKVTTLDAQPSSGTVASLLVSITGLLVVRPVYLDLHPDEISESSQDCNTMGNIAGVSSIVWGCAVQLLAAVSIGSNMTYSATTPHIL